ncbi:hypothetical protein PR202_ga22759 [Eleusine coracana subsp. coracana]|uniref:Peptidase A1 domain-containing protein n=1 Tax=Eleusine coracana subsp. coracana TaxID=191504 RepID=A0AAV5D4D0_ELECO|nr:hypothetical protein QOZ80_9AG0692820 [Eleusine coracana subsp. coracana]GJN05151.1 hypothetical protein PR202_ga22759 [Eleusine coracana subsp. coracana]
MVASIKLPRITLSPRIKKKRRDFLKDHASDIPDLVSSLTSGDEEEPPTTSSGGGRSQQLAGITDVGSYLLSFDVGTPPQRVSGVLLDINSDLVWTQCGCPHHCKSTTSGGGTLFYPNKSSTISKEPSCKSSVCQSFSLSRNQTTSCSSSNDELCFFSDRYIVGNTTGVLATDKFRFGGGGDPVDVVFGCGILVSTDDLFGGVSGVIGLGRGPFSLVSQLGDGRFSYYFAPDGDDEDDDTSSTHSFVHFSGDAKPKTTLPLSTPLLETNAHPKFYYVGLTSIRVDGEDLPIPTGTFDLDENDGSGGVILSITIPVTFLVKSAYTLLREALVSKIGVPRSKKALGGLDLCYTNESLVKIPAVALVFDGGMVMELDKGNYFYSDAESGLECLTILPSSKASLLGGLIQEGTHMVYDVRGNKLQFESLKFDDEPAPAPPQPADSSSSNGWCWSSQPLVYSNFVWVVLVYVIC